MKAAARAIAINMATAMNIGEKGLFVCMNAFFSSPSASVGSSKMKVHSLPGGSGFSFGSVDVFFTWRIIASVVPEIRVEVDMDVCVGAGVGVDEGVGVDVDVCRVKFLTVSLVR